MIVGDLLRNFLVLYSVYLYISVCMYIYVTIYGPMAVVLIVADLRL